MQRRWLRALGPWLPFAFCAALTVAATALVARSERGAEQARFVAATVDAREHIEKRMASYVALLRGVAPLLARAGPMPRDEFHTAIDYLQLARNYPGTQGIGYVHRFGSVSAAEASARAHQLGWANLAVWPDSPREDVMAIVLLEPVTDRNRAALGYDMSTEPTRREAMERARDEGEAVLSGKVTLVQEIAEAKQSGVLLYLPVYVGGAVPPTVEERRARLKGFVYAPLRAGDLLEGIFGGAKLPVSFELHDGEEMKPENLLYELGPHLRSSRDVRVDRFQIAGRTWSARYVGAEPAPAVPLALEVLVFGTLLSAVVWVATRAREAARARELQAEAAAIASQELVHLNELFVGILGHDLRVPLNAIVLGARVLLKQRSGDDGAANVLHRIISSSQRMGRMIDQILDLTRARLGGGLAVVPGPVNLAAIAHQVVEEVEQANPECRIDIVSTGELDGVWDADRLAQVFSNLVGNAVRHCEAKPVRVELSGTEPDRVVVRINNVALIPPERLPGLFEPFHRSESQVRASSGLGLGLYITRIIVAAHGGTLEADSTPERGTTFTFALPRAQQERPDQTPRPRAA